MLVALGAIVTTIVIVVVASDGDGAGEPSQLASAIAPLTPANEALSADLLALSPDGDPAAARRSATEAEDATREARTQLELTDPGSETTARAAVDGALDSQNRYLAAVLGTIDDPSEATVADLAEATEEVIEAWWAVDAALSAARGYVAGFDDLAAWANENGGGASGGGPAADAAADLVDYGSDDALDALADDCEAGGFGACDDLDDQSPLGSSYESFGDTCGGRNEPSGYCSEIYGG